MGCTCTAEMYYDCTHQNIPLFDGGTPGIIALVVMQQDMSTLEPLVQAEQLAGRVVIYPSPSSVNTTADDFGDVRAA